MQNAIIKIAYKQIIDASCKTEFEKDVFNDSYTEFLMQAQTYNPEKKFITLQQLIENNPKANSLHYKVGFAIGLYIKNLNNIIPGLHDVLHNEMMVFESCQFSIIQSDITNKAAHKISLFYTSVPHTFYGTIGNNLLLSAGEHLPAQTAETFLLPLQPNLSVSSYSTVGVNFADDLV